jgi:drug/metabolite transporter (DMT)-like permease
MLPGPCFEISTMAGSVITRNPGVAAALGAALLFGAATPLAKRLLADVGPWLLAGLFYLGSGLGLSLVRVLRRAPRPKLADGDWPWLAGAVASGGVLAPVLLLAGLAAMPASGAALLLNGEGVFTALLAWVVWRENFDRRIALGMAAIAAGAVLLSWPEDARFAGLWPALAVLGACLAWGVDNNLTRRVALNDAAWIATIKGLAAGGINLLLAVLLGARLPPPGTVLLALTLGFFAYGVSLVLFVVALRHLGTARTGAYFSVAPFFGAILALCGGEALTLRLGLAALLMGIGVWLHLTESHRHQHVHEEMEHEHAHVHDEHHRHMHDEPVAEGVRHRHPHHHAAQHHEHAHYPDAHHRGHRH